MSDEAQYRCNDDAKSAATFENVMRLRAEVARLHRCIDRAMGCLDPLSSNRDERLAWYRLLDAQAGKEPRGYLPQQVDRN